MGLENKRKTGFTGSGAIERVGHIVSPPTAMHAWNIPLAYESHRSTKPCTINQSSSVGSPFGVLAAALSLQGWQFFLCFYMGRASGNGAWGSVSGYVGSIQLFYFIFFSGFCV